MKNLHLVSFLCAMTASLILFSRREFARFVLRSLEIQLSDQRKVMAMIDDPLELDQLRASYNLTEREAEAANARFNALLPAGRRNILHVPA